MSADAFVTAPMRLVISCPDRPGIVAGVSRFLSGAGASRVTHAGTVEELVRLGAEVERMVCARAVRWHCEDRVIRHGNSTVVF